MLIDLVKSLVNVIQRDKYQSVGSLVVCLCCGPSYTPGHQHTWAVTSHMRRGPGSPAGRRPGPRAVTGRRSPETDRRESRGLEESKESSVARVTLCRPYSPYPWPTTALPRQADYRIFGLYCLQPRQRVPESGEK